MATTFATLHPNITVAADGVSSALVLDELAAGRLDFGVSADPTAAARYPRLSFTPIAWDDLAIIVHPDTKLDTITLAQLRDLFGGYSQDWSALGLETAPIQLISREEGSGARATFESSVMDGRPVSLTALVKPSDAAVVSYIAKHPGAVGYASRAVVDDTVPRVVKVEDLLPGQPGYPLVRALDLVLPARPAPVARTLRDWLLSPEAQRLLSASFRPAPPPADDDAAPSLALHHVDAAPR